MLWPRLSRHFWAWRAAWRDRHKQTGPALRSVREAEFLPAVLEIQDSPPSPVGRAIGSTIIGVFLVAILWASFGEIDIVAVAQGKIIPSGHSKIIQPLESGVVRAIHVENGQEVRQGELLIELDPTTMAADHQRLLHEYRAARVEAARLRALLAGQTELQAPVDANPELFALQQQRLHDQWTEFQARVEAAKHLIAQRRAAVEATKATVVRLEKTVPMLEEQARAYRKLVGEGFISRVEYLAAEKASVEESQELARQREVLLQGSGALAESEKNHEALVSEYHQLRHAELSEVETRIASLGQEVIKADQRNRLQRLTSPTDGVVQQLAVHTVGGVVTPAQQLMVIVPRVHLLEVEAWVENKDIGFVETGQSVEIKVESFPFTRFGVVEGEVLSVSNDAVLVDEGGLVYAARVAMSQSTMQVRDKLVNLSPGMAVRVEINTGTRRLIEFFLSPLLRGVQETARER